MNPDEIAEASSHGAGTNLHELYLPQSGTESFLFQQVLR